MTADGQTVEKLRKAYRVLDVPEAASALAIKSNYRKLIKRWHPDRPATNAASSAEAMMMTKLINEAYSLIENAPLRYYAGGKGSQTAQTKSAEPKIHSVNDVDLSDMFCNEKRIEYAVRIVCGAISGVFVGFTLALEARRGIEILITAAVCAVAFAVGAVKYGDRFWRALLRVWWRWE